MEINLLNYEGELDNPEASSIAISQLFAFLLHQGYLSNSQKDTFFKAIKEKNLPMVNMAQDFALHLINNFSTETEEGFFEIQKDKIEFNNILSNEGLVDFVEMEMIDPINTYRKWEFGKFALGYFINEIKTPQSDETQTNTVISKTRLIERFGTNLNKQTPQLDDQEQLFLLMVLKQELLDGDLSIASYNLVGDIVQRNLLGMSLRMEVLKNTYRESLSLTINNQNRKGPKL